MLFKEPSRPPMLCARAAVLHNRCQGPNPVSYTHLFYEAIERIREPAAVAGGSVMVIAFAGLLINVAVAWSLSRDRQNVNTRAALLHVLGDLLGSVAAIAAGGIIWAGGPAIVDPLLSRLREGAKDRQTSKGADRQ